MQPIAKGAMDPMPSGGRVHHRAHRDHRGRANARCARGSKNAFSVASVFSAVDLAGGRVARGRRIRATNPMPSGGSAESGAEGAGAASLEPGLAEESADFGGAGAVLPAGAAAAGATGGRAGTSAETAMEAAATVGHGGLAALAAAAGAGTAARGGQEISPGRLPFFSRPRRAGGKVGGWERIRAIDPMSSGRWGRWQGLGVSAHCDMFLGRYRNTTIASKLRSVNSNGS
jgi:hypothetical protein